MSHFKLDVYSALVMIPKTSMTGRIV